MSYYVNDLYKWFSKFNNKTLKIKGEELNFEIELNKKSLLHLIGVHYISKNSKYLRGSDLIKKVIGGNYNDQKIIEQISRNNPQMVDSFKTRLSNLKPFLENLENARLVEVTKSNTKLKSNYLALQSRDKDFLLLGLASNDYEDYFETFIIENSNSYFKNTTINEPVKSITEILDDGTEVPFSFDEEKQKIYSQARLNREIKLDDEIKRNNRLKEEPKSLVNEMKKLDKQVKESNKDMNNRNTNKDMEI